MANGCGNVLGDFLTIEIPTALPKSNVFLHYFHNNDLKFEEKAAIFVSDRFNHSSIHQQSSRDACLVTPNFSECSTDWFENRLVRKPN